MSRQLIQNERKIAEKLIILNDRGIGMLTRIYNIKKACGDAKSKPGFLSDKNLESSIKNIVRRFPNVDVKSLTPIQNLRNEIIKSLSLYYYTFVDLLDFKDHVCELLTSMDAFQVDLDISTNFELTKHYLDLVTTYVSLMVLLSRVEDRKAVLGLFNAAYEIVHGSPDQSFPRLGSMIMDYDVPFRKLCEEFVPHSRLLAQAINSLIPVYIPRNVSADKWRSEQKLTLVGNPALLLKPVISDRMSCEFLSMDTMEKWVVFGLLLIHNVLLQQDNFNKLFLNALESSWVIPLFRDEVVHIHQYIWSFLTPLKDTVKGYLKLRILTLMLYKRLVIIIVRDVNF
ncbi:hypothetical protein NQ314_008529 [Rhamnusium bicolor]|uniref:Uncharacterized protein n=1 Tax=Rhamnusium bicolor TaxID=1586634 RepID=A0AAV8Y8S0_9CUCU|nr:hypothetical protein NQ314_008529 [Rhamnusium bicolor]